MIPGLETKMPQGEAKKFKKIFLKAKIISQKRQGMAMNDFLKKILKIMGGGGLPCQMLKCIFKTWEQRLE